MNRKSPHCACRKFVLIAISLLIPVGIATAAPYGDTNPFERSTFGNDWGILGNDVFFGGADALFGLSPARRTLLLFATSDSKTTSDSNAMVKAVKAGEDFFSFGLSLGSPFGVPGGGAPVTAPNALTAVIEWANVASTWSTGTNWVGGNPPSSSTAAAGDIATFGSAGSAPVNPTGGSTSVSGVSFLSGAFSYNISVSILVIGANGITNSATNTQTFASTVRISTSETFTTNSGGSTVFNGIVDLNENAATARTLTVNGAGDTTFNGVVQNSNAGSTGSLTKTGAGTLVLSNANTYNGSTSVTGGTLLVTNTTGSGTGTSSVVVTNAGTTLSGGTPTGAGGISGPVAINPGATLSPGTSGTGAGTTAILNTGALTLVSASNFNVDLNSLTAGSGYDQLDVTGTVNVSGGNLDVTVGGTFALGDKFFITLNDGTDLVTGTFAQVPTVTADNGYTFLINYLDNGDGGIVGNDISLTLAAIPEPSTWIGSVLALAAIGFTQRRRFSRLVRKAA